MDRIEHHLLDELVRQHSRMVYGIGYSVLRSQAVLDLYAITRRHTAQDRLSCYHSSALNHEDRQKDVYVQVSFGRTSSSVDIAEGWGRPFAVILGTVLRLEGSGFARRT